MIRHIVLLKWKADTTPEQRAAVLERLQTLPPAIPELRSYTLEENIGTDPGNFDLAIIAEVDDLAAYAAYRDHPLHQAVIHESIRPNLEARAALQVR